MRTSRRSSSSMPTASPPDRDRRLAARSEPRLHRGRPLRGDARPDRADRTDGSSELIQLSGPSTAHVFFEGGEGDANDDDGNDLDEVDTELVALSLSGSSPTSVPCA